MGRRAKVRVEGGVNGDGEHLHCHLCERRNLADSHKEMLNDDLDCSASSHGSTLLCACGARRDNT